MDPEICCYVEEAGKAGIQVALTKHELKIMSLVWLYNHSKAPFLSPKRNTEMLVLDRKKMLQQLWSQSSWGLLTLTEVQPRCFK